MTELKQETIISDLEFEEYKSKYYKQLREHKVKVLSSENTFKCPHCFESKEYSYKDLCRHACIIARESRSADLKEKAKHMALEEYLERYFDSKFKDSESSSKSNDLEENSDKIMRGNSKEELVVWPWMAVVANIPVEYEDDSYLYDGFLGDMAKNLKDEWIKQGYKPLKVYPLWSWFGYSGFALVKFGKELEDFNNAMRFVNDFEVKKHGRKDWNDSNKCKDDKLYAWIARDEDYFSNDHVGDFLRKNWALKTLSEIEKEIEIKSPKLVMELESLLDDMSKKSREIQCQVSMANSHIASVMKQNDMLIENYNKDLKKMKERANKMIEHLQMKLQHEDGEKKMNKLAMLEQKKAYDRLWKLASDEKRDNEKLQNKIMELEIKIDDDKEVEMKQMEVMKNLSDENMELKKKIEWIEKDVKEKEKEIEELKGLNQALLVKEKLINDELEDACKVFISGMREIFDPPAQKKEQKCNLKRGC
ncbi:factor of DNA methylation 4-like [Lactuca sativa]|uniref:factor of DNA methylation 4-like n=1 Tax=Lactuca sativa TaxID=4236 RepID=UPI0022AE783C|nr:factor of DNA methylation 4-like [Lactuca sativa]